MTRYYINCSMEKLKNFTIGDENDEDSTSVDPKRFKVNKKNLYIFRIGDEWEYTDTVYISADSYNEAVNLLKKKIKKWEQQEKEAQ